MSALLSSLLLCTLAHDGDQVVRVQTPTAEDADTVQTLGLDVWTEGSGGPWVDVRVRPGEQALLDLTGLEYTVRVADLGPAVHEERLRLSGPVVHGGMPPETFFSDYAPIDEIEVHLDSLVALRPDLVTASSPGSSFDGRPLRALQISAGAEDAPVVLINGGQHAREWIAVAATTCLADRLIREADTPRVAAALDQVRFVVIPVVNPDGYAHTWAPDGDRFWRKNRRPPEGVDLNRNFPVAFGGTGASGNPGAGNYHGEAPFSEPEAAAMRDLVDTLDPLLALIDVHAYGQLVLYPWGFDYDPAPDDDVLAPAAQTLADGLSAPWAVEYVAIPGAELYPAAGNIMDWAYGERGAYAYGIELRPHGDDVEPPFGFILPPEDIIPVCDELFEGVMGLTELVANADPPGAGDDGGASGGESTSSGTGEPATTGLTSASAGDSGSSSGGPFGGTGGGSASSTSGGSTSTPAGTSAAGSDSTGENASATESDAGCGCTSGGSGSAAMLWGLLLLVPRRR